MRAIKFISAVLSCLITGSLLCVELKPFNIAVLGLGGRAHQVLFECMKQQELAGKKIKVVAVADDNGIQSLDFFYKKLVRENNPLAQQYKQIFFNTAVHEDTQEGLQRLFWHHYDVDCIFITSPNHRHFDHLNTALLWSPCKHLFLEKPLFRTIEEFYEIASSEQDHMIVGLTLRYAPMVPIIKHKLEECKSKLGALKKVSSWERVKFGHALSIIMMNWRRYISKSGGVLLEKTVHDLDLALYFMQVLGVDPQIVSVNTQADHGFFKKSRKQEILNRLLTDDALRASAELWDTKPWQRVFDFARDAAGNFDWPKTLDNFFAEFPDNDDFTGTDIIPDHQILSAEITSANGQRVDYELEVDLRGYRTLPERGIHFEFEHGTIHVDIIKSEMQISLDNKLVETVDLHALDNKSRYFETHAGGDKYVARAILGVQAPGQLAMFDDPSVQLSTLMALISEYEAANHFDKSLELTKNNKYWSNSIVHQWSFADIVNYIGLSQDPNIETSNLDANNEAQKPPKPFICELESQYSYGDPPVVPPVILTAPATSLIPTPKVETTILTSDNFKVHLNETNTCLAP